MEDHQDTPPEEWTKDMVSSWLTSIRIKDEYIRTLHEEDVDGRVLLVITEDFLQKLTGMRSGPAFLIIQSRNELVERVQKQQDSQIEEQIKSNAEPRPFGRPATDYNYIKHDVLQPETGVIDLITPCHEYKSFYYPAAILDARRLKAKLAYEVLKFATGCMNMRSNGTIHLGVMGSEDLELEGCVHGEIVGIPIREKAVYADALEYIDTCFEHNSDVVRKCIKPPEFIPVIDRNSKEQHYVVEFEVEPSVSLVRGEVFSVCLPRFREEFNKCIMEKETTYRRVGAKTEPVTSLLQFNKGLHSRDAEREAAEKSQFRNQECGQDLERKLIMLLTSGKKQIEEEKFYILVTNKFSNEDLQHIDFLMKMKLFCVFDFNPDSMVSGLCHEYNKHHKVNIHSMENYSIPSDGNIRELERHLNLFNQTSWIFCNGRNDIGGSEAPCDEKTWCNTRQIFLRECVLLICKNILPPGTFQVIFLLTSPVAGPLLETFNEFFSDMRGHEDIICISESERNFLKWQESALKICSEETVNNSSVVGLKMSHINATLQQIQSPGSYVEKQLSLFVKAKCSLQIRDEEEMYSLEILGVNQCEERAKEYISKKEEIERDFYRGGKVTWMNFWLAEVMEVGEVVQRDAFTEVCEILEDALKGTSDQIPVKCINIYHYPGSGGSTVARQVLWKYRKGLRCAVVKKSDAHTVSKHAVMLREHEEKDPHRCLPVLLLLDDCESEYVEELKHELETAVNTKKIAHGVPCFILLSCRRSFTPEKRLMESPLLNVCVTHKLSPVEKSQFASKRQTLEKKFKPEFILTFVLMSEEFKREYVEDIVKNLLHNIDHSCVETKLILYVALLNTYVENSFISQSHCEALLNFQFSIYGERSRQHAFENSLSERAKFIFTHSRDETTHMKSIRIIHRVVAKEILHQLLRDKLQSELALDLLSNDVLFNHRFRGEAYRKFLRDLFIRRYKISRGDQSDTLFSPLIEHVKENEKDDNAIDLLIEAYKRFQRDAILAQELARLFYSFEKFDDETAANEKPNNSNILNIKAEVYKKWFTTKCNALELKTPESTVDAIETALKAIECFEKCQPVAVEEPETMNNSGFFGLVEMICSLLGQMSSFDVFSNNHSEFQKYLVTQHIPEEIEAPWKDFHYKLKSLQSKMHKALEWISEELNYFHISDTEKEGTSNTWGLSTHRPKCWLVEKSSLYGRFFCVVSFKDVPSKCQLMLDSMREFSKSMAIYQLGGGNFASIFSILDQEYRNQRKTLEKIISLYPKDVKMDQVDCANYIASHFALSVIAPRSPKLASFKDLQRLVQQFLQDNSKYPPGLFLCTLLFWPENNETDQEKAEKYKSILTAVKFLLETYKTKMKDISTRRRRIYIHFYLGEGCGYDRFVHRNKLETIRTFPSVSENHLKWLKKETWKTPKTQKALKRVNGWTEGGAVYLEGPQTEKFPISALEESSIPSGNENVTFYLGFTFKGPVACDIRIEN